jgi:polyribonucleotide nucleotidyltransferase
MMHRIEREFAGRTLIIETGRMARLAQGSALVQFGESQVLCAVTVQDRPTHLPFFPLTVEYREKSYAAGKIPGGFFKREGRPGEKEILSARQIDRPLRPLFPDGFMHETQVNCQILSADQENDADVLALIAASVALNISKIPFNELVASVRVGRIRGTWILNPTFQQLEYSDVDVVVAGTRDAITMVEGGAVEVPEEEILEGSGRPRGHPPAHRHPGGAGEGPPPARHGVDAPAPRHDLEEKIVGMAGGRISEAMKIGDKTERNQALAGREGLGQGGTGGRVRRGRATPPPRNQVGDILRSYEKKAMRERS